MDEILRDFVVETTENIDLVDAELVRFEHEPNNREIVAQIFRLVHTVKGTCGFLGLPRLEALAHAAESMIGRLREGAAATPETVSLILEAIDGIKFIVAEIDRTTAEPDGDDATLIAALEQATSTIVRPAAGGDAPEGDDATGTLVYQHLERPLRSDEVSLDHLEQAFRDAPGPEPTQDPAEHNRAGESRAVISGIDLKRDTIRVAVSTLEHLMTMVSELVLTRNQLLEISRRVPQLEYAMPLQRLSQVAGELQDGVMKTRMQSIGHAWATLPRLVRDLCHELGKEIELEAEGADTEIDRQLLELIKDPITHMIRNAADHGIETPAERIAAGKPRRGRIRLSATQEGGYIKLVLSDDGRGLNLKRIRRKGLALGLVTEADLERMNNGQIARLVFAPGFSTAETITSISGRGVGMDVVRANIERAGGTIDLRSSPGEGTTATMKIPLTLAIAAALIVVCAGQRFALPQLAIVEVVRPRGGDARLEMLNGAAVLRLREQLLPVSGLDSLLGLARQADAAALEQKFIVIGQFENHLYGLAVDAVLQTEEIVVKPVSQALRGIPVYSGTTILGDGAVIMILDPNGIGATIGTLPDNDIRQAVAAPASRDLSESKTALLVFKAGGDGFKAVPLGLVTRLEEVDASAIEHAEGRSLLQYRGRLMPLVPANDAVTPRVSGAQPLLVFSRGDHIAGVLVDEIVDIVEGRFEIEQGGTAPGCIGTAIVRGRATDIVDVALLLPFLGKDEPPAGLPDSKPAILLADDNDFFRALLGPVLNAAGFRVHLAASGEEVLNLLTSHRCDALVIDLHMPGLTGFDVAERLKADNRHRSLRIIGLSELGSAALVARGHAIGFDDIVGKFDRHGLVVSLRDLTVNQDAA
jgi:two-component system chemotaxis sensor kinase CheA